MPLYFNVKPYVVRVILSDGQNFGLPPRAEVFIPESKVSADIGVLLRNHELVYRGHTEAEQMLLVKIEPQECLPDVVDTSNVLQDEYSKIDKDDEAIVLDDTEESDLMNDVPKRRGRKKRPLGE